MKFLKLPFIILIILGVLLSSCSTVFEDDLRAQEIYIEQVVSKYDLWYVDYHRTIGNGDIPFVSRAFTLSFLNGILYANNNIADIGFTGNGLGIDVGTYNTFSGVLETLHDLDGRNDFEVTVTSSNEITVSYSDLLLQQGMEDELTAFEVELEKELAAEAADAIVKRKAKIAAAKVKAAAAKAKRLPEEASKVAETDTVDTEQSIEAELAAFEAELAAELGE